MNLNNQAELETYFADNFDTVLFPILADMYLHSRDLVRARKVCEIGLGYHPDHVDGRFILAMVELEAGNERESEKLLKEVVQSGTDHLQAAFQLAIVQQSLGRAESTLQKSWNKVLDLDPENREAKSILSILGKQETPKKLIQRKKHPKKRTGNKTKTRRAKKYRRSAASYQSSYRYFYNGQRTKKSEPVSPSLGCVGYSCYKRR